MAANSSTGFPQLKKEGVKRMTGISTKPNMSSARLREQELQWETLSIDLIREKIVQYAIHQDDGKFSPGTACRLRLVGKMWNDSVVRILWKCKEPLYKIPSHHDEKLEMFTKIFQASSNISHRFPPFSLINDFGTDLNQSIRVQAPSDNLPNLFNFLTNCGTGLLQMEIWIHLDTQSICVLAFDIPDEGKLPVSQLKTLDMKFNIGHSMTPEYLASNPGLRLIKLLLNGANSLSDCCIQLQTWEQRQIESNIFPSINLPSSITTLRVGGVLGKENLILLAQIELPNLTNLTFNICKVPFPQDVLFLCLEKFRDSLKNLAIDDSYLDPDPRQNPTRIRFPVMESLEQLRIKTINVVLEHDFQSLRKLFPKLSILRLIHQTTAMFRKWTTGTSFVSVNNLELLLADGRYSETDSNFLLNLGTETMKPVNLAFPHLRKLKMSVSKQDLSGLHYVFMEMERLVELSLIPFGVEVNEKPDEWDGLLTGVPVKMIKRSRKNSNFWLRNQMIKNDTPSIGKLQELTTFHIEGGRDYYHVSQYISDFTLQFVLLHMPKLKSVYLTGGLELPVSGEMVNKWKLAGRRLDVVKEFWKKYI